MAYKKRMTLLQLIRENHDAIPNDELRVWVDAGLTKRPYHEDFKRWYDEEHARLLHKGIDLELIPAHKDLVLVPKQRLLYLYGPDLSRQTLLMFPLEQPIIDLPNGRFVAGSSCYWFRDMTLGDSRYYWQAAKRAVKETGNRDWIGGIADFATRFVRPSRAARAAQAAAERQSSWQH